MDTYYPPATLDAFRQLTVDPTAVIHDPHLSIFLQPERISIGAHSRIDGLVKLQGGERLMIGRHVHIASFCTINAGGGTVCFCNHSGCSNGVVIAAGQPDLSYLHISAADLPEHIHPVRKTTVIGPHVVIFANATILPGVSIGPHSVVAAGAVVTADVPPYTVVAGVPARAISYRELRADGTLATISLNGPVPLDTWCEMLQAKVSI